MSKAHDPHWRYVALRLEGPRPVGRRALQNALLGRARREGVADADAPQLTRFAWPHAIVKVHHHALAATRQWLPRIDFAVEGDSKVPLTVATLSSSGTIKALTDRLGILDERGEKGRGDDTATGAARPTDHAVPGPARGADAPSAKARSARAGRREPPGRPSGAVAPPGRRR